MAELKKMLKRKNLASVSGELSNPKIMYMPPNNYLERSNLSNVTDNSMIQIIDSRYIAKLLMGSEHANDAKSSLRVSNIHQMPENNTEEAENEDFSEAAVDDDVSNEGADETWPNNGNIIIDPKDLENPDDPEECDQVEIVAPAVNQEGRHVRHDSARCCGDCREERERFENLMIRKMNELLQVARGNAEQFVERQRPRPQLLPPMPFNTIERLRRFDGDIQENEQMRTEFIQKMRDIGGKTVQKSVKYCMELIMTDELTKNVVWILGAENIPKISKFKFPYLIIETIREKFQNTTIKDLELRIADWLRRGGDRIKCATAMANKRRQQQQQG